MERIVLGKKKNIKYDFRETCFGIVYKNHKFYVSEKNNEISLIGGGIESNETHTETLKREFMEEAGLTITNIKDFITIDCYWKTRYGDHMNSLANFYIVSVSDKIAIPTENSSKLIILDEDKIEEQLMLPYQKKAIKIYINTYINLENNTKI